MPVTLTALLAVHSNRPEIGYAFAGGGSLHPANLLMLVFADVFGASDFNRDLWGPPGFAWHDAFGQTGLYVAQNIGQIYAGALVIVAVLGFGVVRGLLWTREVRFFTIAMVLTLLYALGKYTPVFHLMYDFVPGVTLYRRPADATFVFCALLALLAGYLVHRLLTGTIPPLRPWQRVAEFAIAVGARRDRRRPRAVGRRCCKAPRCRSCGAWDLRWLRSWRWCWRAASRRVARLRPPRCWPPFRVADLGWNNAPNESTGLKPSHYEALRPDTTDETVTLLKTQAQGRRRARPPRPRRVDRRRLSLAEHRADPRLRSSVRAQSAAAAGLRARHRRA